LDEFYAEYARKESAEDWLDAHDYQDTMPEDQDAVWMAK
jgi:hypothetical protein